MFRGSILACVAVGLLLTAAATHASLISGLEVYASMDTTTATGTVPDEWTGLEDHELGVHGTTVPTVDYDAGRGDKVLTLYGSTSGTDSCYGSYGQDEWTNLGTDTSFSISFWFKVAAFAPDGHVAQVIAQDYRSNVGWSMYCYAPCQDEGTQDYLNRPNGSASCMVRSSGGVLARCTFNAADDQGGFNDFLNDLDWHHFVMTFDRTDNKVRGYIDGISSGDTGYGDGAGSAWTSPAGNTTGSGTLTNANHYRLGCNDVKEKGFEGGVDDFAMWKRVLSPSEVQSIYQGTAIIPEPGTLVFVFSAFGGLLCWRRR